MARRNQPRFRRILTKKGLLFIVTLAGLALTLLFISSDYSMVSEFRPFRSSPGPICRQPRLARTKKPIVLFYSKYFGEADIFKKELEDCKKCLITSDKCYYNHSDIVIFHWPDLDVSEIPAVKISGQRWILFNQESPDTIISRGVHRGKLDAIMKSMDDFMSYRSDSSIYLPYGQVIPVNVPQANRKEGDTFSHDMWIIRNKTRLAAWFVSNCHTKSKREDYVKELKKHIVIDVYGSCGDHKCPRVKDSDNCYQMVGEKYYFYLSFENSLCKDYVTEKLFNILSYDVVPVVFGDANYKELMPPDSYINALDFKEPKDLSQYLSNLSQDSTQYLKYFKWKKNFRVLDSRISLYESLCDTMCNLSNSTEQNLESHHGDQQQDETQLRVGRTRFKLDKKNFRSWWFKASRCHSWGNSLFSSFTSIFQNLN